MRFRVETSRAQASIDSLRQMAERANNLARPLSLLGTSMVQRTRRDLAAGIYGVRNRSRELSNSLTSRVEGHELTIGSPLRRAAALQSGPIGGYFESYRPGGYLAIPVGLNVDTRGRGAYRSPLDVADGFFFRSKGGTLLFGRRRDKETGKRAGRKHVVRAINKLAENVQQSIEVLFVLLKRVKGRAWRYVRLEEEDKTRWGTLSTRWIERGS